MSFYSSGDVVTKYVDPKSFLDGSRAVFHLDGHHLAYLPNMRLQNLGVFGQADGVYNKLVGAPSIIEQIVLYDGRTELERINKFGLYRAFQLHNMDNQHSRSYASQRNLHQLGFEMKQNTPGLLDFDLRPAGRFKTTTVRDTSSAGALDLREVLPMLNAVTHLPSDVFQNLRLEVTFNTAAAAQILEDTTHTITGQTLPVLAVDILDSKPIVDKMNRALGSRLAWLSVEHDQVFLPQMANNGGANDSLVKRENVHKLDGYKNKSVERLLQIKEEADIAKYLGGGNSALGFGRYMSNATQNESIQYRLNGRNVIPDTGIKSPMQQLGQMVDTYGECVAYPGSNQTDLDPGAIYIGESAADGKNKGGNLAYNGIYLGERIMDLQITFSNVGLQDNTVRRPSTDSLNLHYFAEVKKGLIIGNNGYNLVYL